MENNTFPLLGDIKLVYEFVLDYCAPVNYILGIFGNIIAIVVFCKIDNWHAHGIQYLLPLAISDLINCLTLLVINWIPLRIPRLIGKEIDLDIQVMSLYVCKFLNFFWYTAMFTSSWLVAVYSCERLVAVYLPLKINSLVTGKKRYTFVAGIIFLSVTFGSQCFHTFTIQETSYVLKECNLNKTFPQNIQVIIVCFVLCAGYLMPALSTAVVNTLIIIKLMKTRNIRKTFVLDKFCANNQERNACMLLLLISTVMVVTYTVMSSGWILFFIHLNDQSLTSDDISNLYDLGLLGSEIVMVSYSCNFLFYVVRMPHFRKKLMTLIADLKPRFRRTIV